MPMCDPESPVAALALIRTQQRAHPMQWDLIRQLRAPDAPVVELWIDVNPEPWNPKRRRGEFRRCGIRVHVLQGSSLRTPQQLSPTGEWHLLAADNPASVYAFTRIMATTIPSLWSASPTGRRTACPVMAGCAFGGVSEAQVLLLAPMSTW